MGKSDKNKKSVGEVINKEYSITKSSNLVLDGVLTYRDDQPMNGPVVVFVHGTLSSYDHNFTNELTTKLANEFGIRSFRYNSRFDKTEEEPDHRYKFSGYEDDLDDIEAVTAALIADNFLPWCYFGHSRGANDILLYAERKLSDKYQQVCNHDDDLKLNQWLEQFYHNSNGVVLDKSKIALIAAAPRFDMTKMPESIFSVEQLEQLVTDGNCTWETQRGNLLVLKEDYDVVTKVMNMSNVVANIPSNVPILLLHGTDDELIPVTDADLYKAARPSIDVCIVDKARHAFRGKKQNKVLLATVSDWLKQQQEKIFDY